MTRSHILYLFGGQFCDFSPSECWQGIDELERNKAAQFCQLEDQASFVITRANLRKVLAQFSGMPECAIRLTQNASGKIHFAQRLDIHFSVAHTKDAFVIALSLDFPVGVDIESENREFQAFKIANVLLRPEERQLLENVRDEKSRNHLLLKTWTQKEALIKCLGKTLEEGMQEFSLIHKNASHVIRHSNLASERTNWYLQTGFWLPSYLISVAMQVPKHANPVIHAEALSSSLFQFAS